MSTAVAEKAKFVSKYVTTETIGEYEGESTYGNKVSMIRYTIRQNDETYTLEMSDAKGTIGAYMRYYYITYWGASQDALDASQELVEKAQYVADKFRENGGFNQTWVLSQRVDKIEELQQRAQDALEKFFIYAQIARREIKL